MAELQCYRCGESLAALTLPLSRLDECPSCSVHLHCCRLCVYYDPQVPEQCTEDDAEEVKNKTGANFCDYFKPAGGRFDAADTAEAARAQQSLDELFGDGETGDDKPADDDPLSDAEDLFR